MIVVFDISGSNIGNVVLATVDDGKEIDAFDADQVRRWLEKFRESKCFEAHVEETAGAAGIGNRSLIICSWSKRGV